MTIKPKDICVEKLPYLSFLEKRYLPKNKAIYFVLNSNKEILYIGGTINLRSRFNNHHHKQEFFAINDCTIAWLRLNESTCSKILEKECILYFRPIYNKMGITEDNSAVLERIKIRWSTGEILDHSGKYIDLPASLALLVQIACNIPIAEWDGIAGIYNIKMKGLVRFLTNLNVEITPLGRQMLAIHYRTITSETLETILNPSLPFRQFYLPDNS